ncbi:CAAX prenyl protease 1 homolog [Ciona intestinalis]
MLFESVLGFSWVVYLWESYLSKRQHSIYVNVQSVPKELTSVIDQSTFDKSRRYALDKSTYGFWNGLYSQIESTAILWLGGLPFLWAASGVVLGKLGYTSEHEILHSLVFTLLGSVFGLVTELPWSLYFTFVVEERHGFNKMTLGFFLKDLVKKTLVSQAISLPLTALIIYVVKVGGDYFFVYAWLLVLCISMVLLHIYPEFIAPLFDKYSPLPDGELKTKINELAQSLDFPLQKLYVVEGSKRSAHSNAYMYGFHKNKRIVLFDTLLEDYTPVGRTDQTNSDSTEVPESDREETNSGKGEDVNKKDKDCETKKIGCNTEEVVAVLGHELGHWKFSHMLKNIVIMQGSILFSFFVFGQLMNNTQIFAAFGFMDQQPILIRLYIVFSFIFSPINEIESFLMHILSRRFEFQADEFAVNLGKREKLKSALLKLFKDNLAFPVADWMYSARHYSHPPLLERLRAMDLYKPKQE